MGSGFEVDPSALVETAKTLGAPVSALASAVERAGERHVDTGNRGLDGHIEGRASEVVSSLAGLATTLEEDAATLRQAALNYVRADEAAARAARNLDER